ncbi:hypothetical protein EOPP23_16980 [Endozoicomonas sp. OPT23]|uniref:flagellar biosynthesis anti-sigma factor FlgM n=1 Tax=Endozoicomonas sp. OPT23 TaxID=2072845 RepID=UPI00129ACBD8|nr:flagellar biosynthesis anti-sigma factor FlgM [Endozoicomonas sp. OPT23]MRI34679.1 hypothetical protein [Endozoicomonas sp. OPT23]
MDRNLEVGSKSDHTSPEDRQAHIQMLRAAYLEGSLTVDSSRLADKMLKFEQAVEEVLPKQ